MCMLYFNPHDNPLSKCYYHSYFIDRNLRLGKVKQIAQSQKLLVSAKDLNISDFKGYYVIVNQSIIL